MESIATVSFEFPTETARSNRNALLKSLYELYTSQPEFNQKENRQRYYHYMQTHHKNMVKKNGFDPLAYHSYKGEFKKAKLPKEEKFVTYIPESRFWSKFTHIPTKDLGYMISVARDVGNRGGCIARFILGSIKPVEKVLA